MNFIKAILSLSMVLLMAVTSVVRWHHHDCEGNILIMISESSDLVIGFHSFSIEQHDEHCHHHHSCEDCSFQIDDCFTSDDHFSVDCKFIPQIDAELWNSLYKTAEKEKEREYISRENIRIYSEILYRLLSFRAPPVW